MNRPKLTPINSKEEFMAHMKNRRAAEGTGNRLSAYAQDSLLSHIYQLEDIESEERTTFEQQLLELALKFDRERQED